MSNQAVLTKTKFIDLKSGEESFGWRMYDNYGKDYSNVFLEEELEKLDDLGLLTHAANSLHEEDFPVGGILDYCIENETGIIIDETYHEFSEIQEILQKAGFNADL